MTIVMAVGPQPWWDVPVMDETLGILKSQIEKIADKGRTVIKRSDLTRAAVLVPIVLRGAEPCLIVTKRTMSVAKHKGQISFPGGAREPEDRDEIQNALREAEEEIGIHPSSVIVAGVLDDYATTTGFAVTPVVGFVDSAAKFTPDPAEVAEIIEVPMSALRDPSRHELVTVEYGNMGYRYHRYTVGDHIIWGATAGIIHYFLSVLDREEPR